jgi:hypothetical protein
LKWGVSRCDLYASTSAYISNTVTWAGSSLSGHRVQRQEARLQPDRSFDLLLGRGLVGFELGGINLDLCNAHVRILGSGDRTAHR